MKNLPYKLYLRIAKKKAIDISDSKDRRTALQWIRAIDSDKNSVKAKEHAAGLLLYCLQRKHLIGPFQNAPSTKKNLQEYIFNYNSKDFAELMLREEAKQLEKPPVAVELSGDLCEYVAYQEIPSFGSHFYYAFSPEPVKKWENTKDFIIPRGLLTLTSISTPDTSILAKKINQPKADWKPPPSEEPAPAARTGQFIDASILKDTGELKSGFIQEQELAKDVDTKLLATALRSRILKKSEIAGDITIEKILDPHVEQVEVKKTDQSTIKKRKKNVTPNLEPLLDEIAGPMHYVETYDEYKTKQKLDLTSKTPTRVSDNLSECALDKAKPEQDICIVPSLSRKPLLERLEQLKCQKPTSTFFDKKDIKDKPESTKFEEFLSETIVDSDDPNLLKAQNIEEELEGTSLSRSTGSKVIPDSCPTDSGTTFSRSTGSKVIPDSCPIGSGTTLSRSTASKVIPDSCPIDSSTTLSRSTSSKVRPDSCPQDDAKGTAPYVGEHTGTRAAKRLDFSCAPSEKEGTVNLLDEACGAVRDKSMNAEQLVVNKEEREAEDNAEIMMVYNWARNLSTVSQEKDGQIITTPETDEIKHELKATLRKGDQEETRQAVLTTTRNLSPYLEVDPVRTLDEQFMQNSPLMLNEHYSGQSPMPKTPVCFSPYGPELFVQQQPSPNFPFLLPPVPMPNFDQHEEVYDEGMPLAQGNVIDQPIPELIVPLDPSLLPLPAIQSGEQCMKPMSDYSQHAPIYGDQHIPLAPISSQQDEQCVDNSRRSLICENQNIPLAPVESEQQGEQCMMPMRDFRQHEIVYDEEGMHLAPVSLIDKPIPDLLLPLPPSLVPAADIPPSECVPESEPVCYRRNEGDLIQMSPQHDGICENMYEDLSILHESEMDDMFADHLIAEPVPVAQLPSVLQEMCDQYEPLYGDLSRNVTVLNENEMGCDDMFGDDVIAAPLPVSQIPMPNMLQQMADLYEPVYGNLSRDVTILNEDEMCYDDMFGDDMVAAPALPVSQLQTGNVQLPNKKTNVPSKPVCPKKKQVPVRTKPTLNKPLTKRATNVASGSACPPARQVPLRTKPTLNVPVTKRATNVSSGPVCPPKGQAPLRAKPSPNAPVYKKTTNVASGSACPPARQVPLGTKPTLNVPVTKRATNVPSGPVCPPKGQAPLRAKPSPNAPVYKKTTNVASGSACPPARQVPLGTKPTLNVPVTKRATNVPSGPVCPPKGQAPLRAKPSPNAPVYKKTTNVASGSACPPARQVPLGTKPTLNVPVTKRATNVPSGPVCPPKGQAPLRAKPSPNAPVYKKTTNVASGSACPPARQVPLGTKPTLNVPVTKRGTNVPSGPVCPPAGQVPVGFNPTPNVPLYENATNVASGSVCSPAGQVPPRTVQRSTLQLSKTIKQVSKPSKIPGLPQTRIPKPGANSKIPTCARPTTRTGIPKLQNNANRHAGGQATEDEYAAACDLPSETDSFDDEYDEKNGNDVVSKIQACMISKQDRLNMKEREHIFAGFKSIGGEEILNSNWDLKRTHNRSSSERSMRNETEMDGWRDEDESNEWLHLVRKVLRDGDCREVNDFFCFNIDPDTVKGILLTTANIYTISPKDGIPYSQTRLFEDVESSMADAGYDTTMEYDAKSKGSDYRETFVKMPTVGFEECTREGTGTQRQRKDLEVPAIEMDPQCLMEQRNQDQSYEISGGVFSNIETEEDESELLCDMRAANAEVEEALMKGIERGLNETFTVTDNSTEDSPLLRELYELRKSPLSKAAAKKLDRFIFLEENRVLAFGVIEDMKTELVSLKIFEDVPFHIPPPPPDRINFDMDLTEIENQIEELLYLMALNGNMIADVVNRYYDEDGKPLPKSEQPPKPQTSAATTSRPGRVQSQACVRPSASGTQTIGGPSKLGAKACVRPSTSKPQTRVGSSNLGKKACRLPSKQNLGPSQKPRWR